MVSAERSNSDLSEYTLVNIQKYSFININQFLGEKWKYLGFFLQCSSKLFPMFSKFINSDDCIGKITSKSIRLEPVFIQKKIESY